MAFPHLRLCNVLFLAWAFKQTDAACMPVAASALTELCRTAKRPALALVADGPGHVPWDLGYPARDIPLSGIALTQSKQDAWHRQRAS